MSRLAQPAHDVGGDDAAGIGEKPLGVLRLEALQLELLESGGVERALLAFADGEEDRRRVGNQPFHREDERIARCDVHPLRVVHDARRFASPPPGGSAWRRRS